MGLLASRMLFAPPSTSSITHNSDERRPERLAGWDYNRIRRAFFVWLRLMFGGTAINDGLIEESGDEDSDSHSDDDDTGLT